MGIMQPVIIQMTFVRYLEAVHPSHTGLKKNCRATDNTFQDSFKKTTTTILYSKAKYVHKTTVELVTLPKR